MLLPSATDAVMHITQELQWFCFTSRTQSVLAKDKNYGTLVQALDHQIFQWTVILSNQSTAWFTSLQSSDGPCRPDLTRRIGHACAVMTSLKRIWSDKHLTLDTKLRIGPMPFVASVRPNYTPQTPGPYYQLIWGLWMLSTRSAWDSCLESDCTTESEMMKYFSGPSDFTVSSPILSTHLDIWACDSNWRRHTGKHGSSAPHQCITQPTSWPYVASPSPPGHPRNKWVDQLRNDSTRPIGDLWRRAVDHGHGGATTRRPSSATWNWWWWWW